MLGVTRMELSGVESVGVPTIFGSVAREDAGETSDLDLLVHFKPGSSLMDHGMLVEELQDLLHVKVDVISEGALRDHDRFGREVLKEAVPL